MALISEHLPAITYTESTPIQSPLCIETRKNGFTITDQLISELFAVYLLNPISGLARSTTICRMPSRFAPLTLIKPDINHLNPIRAKDYLPSREAQNCNTTYPTQSTTAENQFLQSAEASANQPLLPALRPPPDYK